MQILTENGDSVNFCNAYFDIKFMMWKSSYLSQCLQYLCRCWSIRPAFKGFPQMIINKEPSKQKNLN